MALSTLKNQFRGLNPLLHSAWLAEGTWSVFHSRHLAHLADLLQAEAYPLGYQVDMERGIQIRRELGRPRGLCADARLSVAL